MVAALGSVMAQPRVSSCCAVASAVGTASAVGVAALTALLACSEGIGNLVKGKMNLTKEKEDPTRAGHKSIGPTTVDPRGGAPK